jgi:ssDNA-binding Zn-finger/Zn-ribbon topoisomerase 1
MLFEIICDVRPDIAKTLDLLGNEGVTWFLRCTEAIRDSIVNPERYNEEIEKSLTVQVTCDKCNKSFRIFREDVPEMKMCPFCGASGEK